MGNDASGSGGRSRALCILGMHRSGTSAVTRTFNLLGAFVGEESDLMRETPDNPEGYWERNDIYEFHERLLAAVQRRWDTGLMLPDGWHRDPRVAPFRDELKRIVVAAFAGRPLWAWKDPRTCILLDLWKDVLDDAGIDLDAVLVLRHPLDVAASLGRRDGFGLEKSCGIWFCHTLAALRSIEGVYAPRSSATRVFWKTRPGRRSAARNSSTYIGRRVPKRRSPPSGHLSARTCATAWLPTTPWSRSRLRCATSMVCSFGQGNKP